LSADPPRQATTWQTVGPFFALGFAWLTVDDLAPPGVSGQRVTIEGHVIDGEGQPVPDAVLELWQANAHGRYAHPDDTQDKPLEPAFHGYGRVPTDAAGFFRFHTIKPGPVPGPDGRPQAPHIAVSVLARGLMRRLVTRIYFPDEPANASDPVLALVPPARHGTLVARREAPDGVLTWDVVLQGPGETAFFDF
jgi:protocatechuate 3,4-dioxygenase, alpha subunit